MKRITFIFAALSAALLISACSNTAKRAESVATVFLNAYLSSDFSKAKELCSKGASDYLSEALKEYESLPDETKESVKAHVSGMKAAICRTEEISSDSIKVYYNILGVSDSQEQADTLYRNRSLIVSKEDGEWVIGCICK